MTLYGSRFSLPTKRHFKLGRSYKSASKYIPELSEIDKALRCFAPDRMTHSNEDVTFRIERICGFELYGHYETWSSGYRVTDGHLVATGEFLDVALGRFAELQSLDPADLKPWNLAEGKDWAEIKCP